MYKKKLMNYINEFLEYGNIQGECTLNGDFKKGNKAYDKCEAIFNIAKNDVEKEKFYTIILNTAIDANTLTKCCAHMLKLNINKKIAIEKLNEITLDESFHPVFRFNAKMFLQEWNKGNIKPVCNK